MQSPPPFKIAFLAGDVKIESSIIEDFSFLPKTINGGLDLTTTDIKSLKGFPTMIYGNLELTNCGLIESFENVSTLIAGSIHINLVQSLKELKAENVKFRGAGVIIKSTSITSLIGLPVSTRLNHKEAPYFHVSDSKIENLIGLPETVSHLYISKCPLESIEGIPFNITEGFRSAVNVSTSMSTGGNREKINRQIDIYYDLLEKEYPKSGETRKEYIKRVIDINPEISSIIPNEELPEDYTGHKILKKFGLF
jgi:hypothetical protein